MTALLQAVFWQVTHVVALQAAYVAIIIIFAAMFPVSLFAGVVLLHVGIDVFRSLHKGGVALRHRRLQALLHEHLFTAMFLGLAVLVEYTVANMVPWAELKGIDLALMTTLSGLAVVPPKAYVLHRFLRHSLFITV